MITQLLEPFFLYLAFFYTDYGGVFLLGYHSFFVDTLILFREHIAFTMMFIFYFYFLNIL